MELIKYKNENLSIEGTDNLFINIKKILNIVANTDTEYYSMDF